MPLLSTRGSASAKGFGLFATTSSCCLTDGNKGIFAIGSNTCGCCGTTTRNKYTYATCLSTAVGVGTSSLTSVAGSAAGNSTRGIFAIGLSSCVRRSTRNKYTYSSCTSTACGVGSASHSSSAGSAAGNSTRGIFSLGAAIVCSSFQRSTIRNKYTYSSCTSTACGVAAASCGSQWQSAVGNSTRGIFALGERSACGGSRSTIRNKYTYSSCTNTSSGVGAASCASCKGSAAGNSTRGIFTLGNNGGGGFTTRNKYTYACCTSTASGVGAASSPARFGSGAGNSTRGIFALGYLNCASTITATRNKYTYSSCTSTASGVGSASAASQKGSAASWATCVNT